MKQEQNAIRKKIKKEFLEIKKVLAWKKNSLEKKSWGHLCENVSKSQRYEK